MLTFLSFYLCFGCVSESQSAWSCYYSDFVGATLTVGLSAPRSSPASSGWFGSMKSEEFQNVCIFGQNFHNYRSTLEVEMEQKTEQPASVSLCQNVISTSPTGMKEKQWTMTHIVTNKYWWLYRVLLSIEIFHLNVHFLLIIDLQFLHEVGEYFSGLDFKWIPLFFLARTHFLTLFRRTWIYLVFIGEERLHLLQPLYHWMRLVNN